MTAETTTLRLSPDVGLPLDYVTKTCAILAQRRKGKTYTASVLAEELCEARIPWVALDPTGAWWGLRSSADGEHPGYPVVVVGGEHADLPLERHGGAVVADLVLDHPGWYVIDLSKLESRQAERDFSLAFARRLHRRKQQTGMDFPLHLFVDEADLFLPQERETRDDNFVLGAFQGIVRRGGLHGLGTTLISQRPALVNKSALTQLDLLILLRLVAGQDQDAVYKAFVKRAGAKEQQDELMGSLASLPVGEAWAWEPGAEPPLFVRTRVRERRTFNSSATPKVGEQRVEPSVFAEVDLVQLREQMAAAVERAQADDPAALRARLSEEERRRRDAEANAKAIADRLHAVENATGGPHVIDELIAVYLAAKAEVGYSADLVDEAYALRDAEAEPREVPVLPPALREMLVSAFDGIVVALKRAGEDAVAWRDRFGEHLDADFAHALEIAADGGQPVLGGAVERTREASQAVAAARSMTLEQASEAIERAVRVPAPTLRPDPPPVLPRAGVELGTGARHLLDTLARHYPVELTVGQLALLANRKARGGAWNAAMKQLREGGFVAEERGLLVLTERALKETGANLRDLSPAEQLERWRGALSPASRDILDKVLAVYPNGRDPRSIAEETGRQPTGGSWNSAVATLVRNGLVVREGESLYATEFAAGLARLSRGNGRR